VQLFDVPPLPYSRSDPKPADGAVQVQRLAIANRGGRSSIPRHFLQRSASAGRAMRRIGDVEFARTIANTAACATCCSTHVKIRSIRDPREKGQEPRLRRLVVDLPAAGPHRPLPLLDVPSVL